MSKHIHIHVGGKAKDEHLSGAPKSPVAYKGFSLYAGTDGGKNAQGQYEYKWYLSSRLGDGLNGYFKTAQDIKDAIDKALTKHNVSGFSAFKAATKDAQSPAESAAIAEAKKARSLLTQAMRSLERAILLVEDEDSIPPVRRACEASWKKTRDAIQELPGY